MESRITLALASRTMMFISGGIGTGTNNIALDENPSWNPEEDESYPPPTPRMMLLQLLERDLLLLTWCDYCRILHSPSVGEDNALLRCCKSKYCFTSSIGAWGAVRITLPLVRRAVMWDRQGLDADSLLATARSSTVDKARPSNPYRSVSTCRARVCGGSVVVKTQLFVARKTACPRGGVPTARDLVALDDVFCAQWLYWARDLTQSRKYPPQQYKTPECLAKGDNAGKSHFDTFRCYRDDIGPSVRALNPTLRCMLTHGVPCRAPACRTEEGFSGHVNRSPKKYLDFSASAIVVAHRRNPWDRVLVFTSWCDLGNGDSEMDAKWQGRHVHLTLGFGRDHCARSGSRVGDAYEAFEGAAEGTPYVPKLPRSVAKRLFSSGG